MLYQVCQMNGKYFYIEEFVLFLLWQTEWVWLMNRRFVYSACYRLLRTLQKFNGAYHLYSEVRNSELPAGNFNCPLNAEFWFGNSILFVSVSKTQWRAQYYPTTIFGHESWILYVQNTVFMHFYQLILLIPKPGLSVSTRACQLPAPNIQLPR